jgi:subtilase family serine protease
MEMPKISSKKTLISADCRPAFVEWMERRIFLSAAAYHTAIKAKPDVPYVGHMPITVIRATASPGTPSATTGSSTPVGGITPQEMVGAYLGTGFNFDGVTGNGAGQTIAIVDAYDDPGMVNSTASNFASSDLAEFDSYYGLPNPPSFIKYGATSSGAVTTRLPGDDPAGPYDKTGSTDWEVEESLDVEWAHVMAPQAKIVLIETKNDSDLFQGIQAADNLSGVNVVSMSFSSDEDGLGSASEEGVYNSDYFSNPRITYLASAGDEGAYGSGTEYATIESQFPASSQDVVAVGGTSLSVSGTSWSSESTWGDATDSGSEGGGGGGTSLYITKPAYQTGFGSGSLRQYPDISLDANPGTGVPIYDSYDFGTGTAWVPGYLGGTSLAAPMMAGLVAVADQGRALDGLTTLNSNGISGGTDIHTLLYSLASSSNSYAADFHDIVSGNSTGPSGSPPNYSVETGYDLATGLGSPEANDLVFDLSGISGTLAVNQPGITSLYYKEDSTSTLTDVWVNSTTPGSGVPTYKFADAEISSVIFNGATGNDSFTVNLSAGSAFASSLTSITYTGSSTGTNSLNIIGSASSNDNITASSANVSVGSVTVAFTNASILTLNPSTGTDVLTINSGTWNISPQITGGGILKRNFSSLSIASGAALLFDTATLHTDRMLVETSALSDAGELDLGGNDMIVHNGNLAAIDALLATGFNNGTWNGTGISSAAAHNDTTHLTALGAIANNLYGGNGQPQFDGASPLTTDILIKFTYYGDTDLNGKIDGSDYSRIDNGYLTSATGWANGDFNYDNHVDGSDYSLIDNAFNTQGNTL